MSFRTFKVGPRERFCEDPVLDENGELSLDQAPPLSSHTYRAFFAKPTLDLVFKFIFANPRRKDLLLSLINTILKGKYEITEIWVLNGELTPDDYAGRKMSLDLLCETKDKKVINVEMYSKYYFSIANKDLLYLCKIHGEQDVSHAEKESDENIKRDLYDASICDTIGITILSQGTFHQESPLVSEYLMKEVTTNHVLSEKFRLFSFDLCKLKDEMVKCEKEGLPLEDIHWWGKFFLTNSEEEMEALMNDFSAPEVIREAAMTLKHVNTYDKLKAIIYDKRLEEIVFREELHLQFIHGIKKGEENMGEVVRKAQEEVRKAQEEVRKAQEDARKAQKSILAKMSSSQFHVPYHEIESLFENLSQEQTDSLAEVLFTFSTLEELKAYLSLSK